MFQPRVPINPAPTGEIPVITTASAITQPDYHHASTDCFCQHSAPAPATSTGPTVQLTPGSLIVMVGAGTAVVLVVGAVLVSMLLAVAITAVALAICALVIRSLINGGAKHTR
ncbi:SpdD-like protein [Streptomyces sp. NPDC021622]|uniref:SpdD-like protein n=1 Tax=Streptomyces sp. NPDC021622 TaxID=3155013 RepID=UPI0033E430BB